MSDIQLVINIDEDEYKSICDLIGARKTIGVVAIYNRFHEMIANGTPLPKEHGDLIDRNEIEYMKAIHDLVWDEITSSECATKIKYSAPTIIEADRSVENG